jgi:hypothetical protein
MGLVTTEKNIRLNDDRQGEGGTLAVIEVNITIWLDFVQVFCVRKILIFD